MRGQGSGSAGIREIVAEKASEINRAIGKEVADLLADRNPSVFPGINAEVAVYDRKTEETLISDDGIQVKKTENRPEKSDRQAIGRSYRGKKAERAHKYRCDNFEKTGRGVRLYDISDR
ncbi:hypothetical protein DENIS_3275 [Desulfonema ishimotonii]|uniref:Uncharacterized protein n=1 Tax=Desulfonema ishimotonii TaxID=45657 RepID=A0A401FZE2_9BACT|nr:hypothetical protein DENIS_3275 [Desulfonema ishimotonii]